MILQWSSYKNYITINLYSMHSVSCNKNKGACSQFYKTLIILIPRSEKKIIKHEIMLAHYNINIKII